MQNILNILPDNIFDFYRKTMERIKQQKAESCYFAKEALLFISHTKRLLHVNELRHTLGVSADDTEFDESQCMDNKVLIDICAGLVKIDETRDVIGLTHQTLQEFFNTFPERLCEDSDSKITKTCLVYLSFDVFGSGLCADDNALQERLEHHVFFPYTVQY